VRAPGTRCRAARCALRPAGGAIYLKSSCSTKRYLYECRESHGTVSLPYSRGTPVRLHEWFLWRAHSLKVPREWPFECGRRVAKCTAPVQHAARRCNMRHMMAWQTHARFMMCGMSAAAQVLLHVVALPRMVSFAIRNSCNPTDSRSFAWWRHVCVVVCGVGHTVQTALSQILMITCNRHAAYTQSN
jgi:hypothetical protein